jgi:hypothetical protein
VRASEAILFAIQAQGGEVPAWQFQEWLSELTKRGYLEYDAPEDKGIVIRMTEKAREFLKRSEYCEAL